MSLFIISGLSGSGKSIALQALEDLGLYCIDNLPASLLLHFANLLSNSTAEHIKQAAISIDARNKIFLDAVPESLDKIKSIGINYKIIYLEADESILVKRFKETRRKHPLTDDNTSLLEGIRHEKILLEALSSNAILRIDSTHTTPHELRKIIHDFVRNDESGGMTLMLESFGFKHGTPLDADYVFDVRCLPNPHWKTELRNLTGLDDPVRLYLESHDEVRDMLDQITTFLNNWLPHFKLENRSYMTIAIGCTGGQHRSVYLVEQLAKQLKNKGQNILIRHRELP